MIKIIDSITIVKFFNNSINNYNNLITRTLKKVGVINRDYRGPMPSVGEIWKVKIINEIYEKQNKGCFVLEPINIVEPKSIIKLLPGMFEEKVIDNILLITPKESFSKYNCILPLNIKRNLIKYRAIIVVLN